MHANNDLITASFTSTKPNRSVEDFDVAGLAAHLHLTPDQVTKMATRGKIPGRRVGNQWRFSEAEIHHWFEERIGISDAEELGKVTELLDKAKGNEVADRPIADLCQPELIEVPMNSRTRGSVIRTICNVASRSGMLWDSTTMAEAVAAREQMHPTALDCGVALLHPRRPQTSILADSVIALGVCPSPIPFADRGQLTDVFFLICSYDDTVHLRILAKLSRLIADGTMLDRIRQSNSSGEAWAAIQDSEQVIDDV